MILIKKSLTAGVFCAFVSLYGCEDSQNSGNNNIDNDESGEQIDNNEERMNTYDPENVDAAHPED